MTFRSFRWIAPLALAVAALFASHAGAEPAEGEAAPPVEVVETLHDALISVMREAESLGYQGRYERLEPVLERTFNLGFMAEKSVGRHWKDLGPEDRQRWLDAFKHHTVANYAGRFDGFSGQRFETLGHEPAAHETQVVRTRLVIPDDEDVPLNYRLLKGDEGWQIVDVYLNGTVSELALRRSEYGAVLNREGFDQLLAQLGRQTRDLAEGVVQ